MAYLAAALGGALGALARWGVSTALPHRAGAFPWATLLVNLTGCLLIGVLLAAVLPRPGVHPLARPFLTVGVLGGYTTYSTFAVDTVQLWARPAVAVLYVAVSVVGCLAAVVAGLRLGRAAGSRPGRRSGRLR
jgi:CrcB protein